MGAVTVSRAYLIFSLILFATSFSKKISADDVVFNSGQSVRVYLNWEAFTDQGFPSYQQAAMIKVIKQSLRRWQQVSGADFFPYYAGLTTKSDPSTNEIVITIGTSAGDGTSTLAHGWWWPGQRRGKIRFYNEFVSQGQTVASNWKTYHPGGSSYNGRYIGNTLLHELGHTFGMQHNSDNDRNAMYPYMSFGLRSAPLTNDTDRLVALYGKNNRVRIGMKESRNQGDTWSNFSNDLPQNSHMATTMPFSAIRDRNNFVVAYTNTDKKPCWIVGEKSGSSVDFGSTWICFGGLRSYYGVDVDGKSGEYMMAYVDHDGDQMIIKVVRSTDTGKTWSYRNPPTSRTISTPAIVRVSSSTWLLTYAKLDLNNKYNNGRVVYRVSYNDGSTWSSERNVTSGLSGFTGEGVSATATRSGNDVRIAFSRDITGGDYYSFIQTQLLINLDNVRSSNTNPTSTAIHSPTFEVAGRPNAATNYAGMKMIYRASNDYNYVRIGSQSISETWSDVSGGYSSGYTLTPALAADTSYNWMYMFYVK